MEWCWTALKSRGWNPRSQGPLAHLTSTRGGHWSYAVSPISAPPILLPHDKLRHLHSWTRNGAPHHGWNMTKRDGDQARDACLSFTSVFISSSSSPARTAVAYADGPHPRPHRPTCTAASPPPQLYAQARFSVPPLQRSSLYTLSRCWRRWRTVSASEGGRRQGWRDSSYFSFPLPSPLSGELGRTFSDRATTTTSTTMDGDGHGGDIRKGSPSSSSSESPTSHEEQAEPRRRRRGERPGYLGYSRKDFFRKVHNPRASKPWQNRHVETTGAVYVTPHSDILADAAGTTGAAVHFGRLTSAGALGMRSPHLPVDAARQAMETAVKEPHRGGGETPGDPQTALFAAGNEGWSDERQYLEAEGEQGRRRAAGGGEPSHLSPSLSSVLRDRTGEKDKGVVAVVGDSDHRPQSLSSSSSSSSALYPSDAGVPQPWRSYSASVVDDAAGAAPIATIPFGNALNVSVDQVETYSEGAIPLALQQYHRHPHRGADQGEGELVAGAESPPVAGSSAGPSSLTSLSHGRSKRELANSIRLPRHINKLFHKIMGWSNELEELEIDRSLRARSSDEEASGELAAAEKETGLLQPAMKKDAERQMVRQKMHQLTDQMKYGVLLADYEKDHFALEHQIAVAGNKMERKFLQWKGMHVLDQDHTEPMPFLSTHKAALVMQSPSTAAVPVVNRDCCPGCGALLQDKSEEEFGYVAPGEVEKFVMERDRRAEAREAYAQRMAELQRHWEKHGRQVGEEWLDFMTQEEFNAFYRDRQAPFVCHRCHALEHLGVTGRRQVWSAPDFTEKLKALREKKCVVVLVVDITDFPGSMVHNLPGLISMNNPVIIAANKMDCVRNRSFRYAHKDRAVSAALVSERYVKRWVMDIAIAFGLPRHQIKDVVPVSAKRGWNMDILINSIETHSNLNLRRPHRPLPTYFVGAANVGKSSVINAMAHHLYVPQPPHPESKKVYYTLTDPKTGEESIHWRWYTPPNVNRAEMIDIPSRHDKKASKLLTVSSLPGTTVGVNAVRLSLTGGLKKKKSLYHNPNGNVKKEEEEEESPSSTDTYIYDTPGVLPHWHATSPLTLLQMRRLLQRKFRHPQCFVLVPGNTILLAGLAAIDVVKGCTEGMLFMVYTSQKAQHAIVQTAQSDAFWMESLGTRIGPPDSLEQLQSNGMSWTSSSSSLSSGGRGGGSGPGAAASGFSPFTESRSYLFECYARHRRRPVADIYVCGLGWVSFCVREPADVVVRVRTLPGVVHGVRRPLRYNDLRAFRFWPKIRRQFTHKGIDEDSDENEASIATVVKLVAGASSANGGVPPTPAAPLRANQSGRGLEERGEKADHTRTNQAEPKDDDEEKESNRTSGKPQQKKKKQQQQHRDKLPEVLNDAPVRIIPKTPHVQFESASETPLSQLLDDLHQSGSGV